DKSPSTLLDGQKIDVAAGSKTNIGFTNIAALAKTTDCPLGFALDVQNLYRFNFYVEQCFHSLFDFRLGCVRGYLENDLIAFLGEKRGLFGDMRTFQYLKNALLINPSITSNFFNAGTVTTTFS